MKTVEGKVVALGAQGVGKTSMIIRYIGKAFKAHDKPTIGAAFFTCKVNVENTKVKLQVWDTAGQERFRSMAPMYYRNANAAMLVFDLTAYESFVAIKTWVTELRRNVDEAMVLAVVGNKSDLWKNRQVTAEEGRAFATKIGASYHETSVVQDEGIDNVFLAISTGLLGLSTTNHETTASLKVYDSNNMMCLTPSYEESPQNSLNSIAHGIDEKPHACC